MDVNFCGACGAPLPSKSAKMCVKCGSDPRISANYCPSCGEKLKNKDAVMCIKCGAPLRGTSADKDPAIAALISFVCMFVAFGASAAGYIYLGKVKKGIVYLIASWTIVIVTIGAIYLTLGCCFPLIVIPLLFDLVMVYDVYLDAKGEKTILPEIAE